MRFGGEKEKYRVKCLLDFLETWCSMGELALKKIDKADIDALFNSSKILLLKDRIEESIEKARLFLQLSINTDEYNKSINEYFILLMAKKQNNSLIKLFNVGEFKLKDKFKPTYYALMYFMKNQNEQFDIEYRKVSEELEQTVEEIIEEVKKMKEISI